MERELGRTFLVPVQDRTAAAVCMSLSEPRTTVSTAEPRTRDWRRKKNSNQTVHHGLKFVDEQSGPRANIVEITWTHTNASKLEVQLLPLEVHILEEL